MERHKPKVELWRYIAAFALIVIFINVLFFTVYMLRWMVIEMWPRIMGTGEHAVRMVK